MGEDFCKYYPMTAEQILRYGGLCGMNSEIGNVPCTKKMEQTCPHIHEKEDNTEFQTRFVAV